MSDPTTLYRAFDTNGQLLYVGIAVDAFGRFAQHRSSRWATYAVTITLERHSDRATAAAAELEAIHTEDPVFNSGGRCTTRSMKWLIAYPQMHADDISDAEVKAAAIEATEHVERSQAAYRASRDVLAQVLRGTTR